MPTLGHPDAPDLDVPDDIGAPGYDDRAEWLAPPVPLSTPLPADVRRSFTDDEWDGFVADTRSAARYRTFDDEAADAARDIRAHVAARGGRVER